MPARAIALPHPETEEGPSGFTEDRLLGGQLVLRQPRDGFRVAIDSVLLAAAVPARSGDSVIEPGVGAGGAALCLARRAAGCRVTGIELQPDLARLAGDNARANGLEASVDVIVGDIARPPPRLSPGGFDHAMLNPPFLPAARADAPPGASRRTAHVEGDSGLDGWIDFAVNMIRPRGTVTIVHRADRLDALLAHLRRRTGGIVVFPLWPAPGNRPAKRIIVHAVKDSAAPMVLSRGLVLHETDGSYSAAADAALRGGALELSGS